MATNFMLHTHEFSGAPGLGADLKFGAVSVTYHDGKMGMHASLSLHMTDAAIDDSAVRYVREGGDGSGGC
jgi:hypothetical protein